MERQLNAGEIFVGIPLALVFGLSLGIGWAMLMALRGLVLAGQSVSTALTLLRRTHGR